MKRMLPRGTPILKCDEKPREKATLRGDSGAGLGAEWGVNSGGGRPAPEGRWPLKPPTCPPCSERACPRSWPNSVCSVAGNCPTSFCEMPRERA